MKKNLEKAGAWARTVGQWVGDSPYKAVTFAGACILFGYLLNIWPF